MRNVRFCVLLYFNASFNTPAKAHCVLNIITEVLLFKWFLLHSVTTTNQKGTIIYSEIPSYKLLFKRTKKNITANQLE